MFENKIWGQTCGPAYDETNIWQRSYNRKLYNMVYLTSVINFITGQRLQFSFSYVGPKIFNSLLNELCTLDYNKFKVNLTIWLIQQAVD